MAPDNSITQTRRDIATVGFVREAIQSIPVGGGANWNQNDPKAPDYVKNRTHWEEDNQTIIEWDGDRNGHEVITIVEDIAYAVRVSSLTPTIADVIGGTVVLHDNNNPGEYLEEILTEDNVLPGDYGCFMVGSTVIVVTDAPITISGIAIDSNGVYFMDSLDGTVKSLTYGSTAVHKLDEKFIPDSIARKTDVGQNQDYAALNNKPRINGVELSGDKTAADLGIEGATDEQVRKAVSDHLAANPVEASPMSGYTGLVWDAGQWVAYNPLVQTIADRARATKLSAYLQHYANEAKPVSPAGVLSHESSIAAPGIATWVENVAGTANDVPTIDGVTAVKARYMGAVYNFPKVGDIWEPEGDAVVVAQQGDEVINTVTGETFAIPGGTGYQTFVNGSHVLCGYVPSYNQLRGMTVPVSYGSDGASPVWGVMVGTRNAWTLTIDGELGEYVYSRLPAPANTAVLHPSNQVAKIGSTYYRADVVPSDGIVICSSTDLINWTYVAHVHLPEGFASKGLYEACLGTKQNRLYAAIRQNGTTGALYLCKLAADLKSVNTIVALPDCSSKPYFVPLDNNNLLLATAPVDRYSCLVYNILDRFNITKILPVFEVSGVACNYPHLATIGIDPALLAIIGTNGAQTDLNGVSALPCMIYWKNIIKRVLAPTDIMLHDAEKAVTWGNIYELPTFPEKAEGTVTE